LRIDSNPCSAQVISLFVIYGPGGIGKTMLMRKFRDIANEIGIVSSIASMDAINSTFDILTSFRENVESHQYIRPFQEFDTLIVKF